MTGKKHSEATKLKMSAAAKGKKKPWLKGRQRSEEEKIKRSVALRAFWKRKKKQING